jgi:D-alanyl-D-alanine carboxypeptidase (penicillin-binding protein 5/6)
VLYAKKANARRPIASITKIMTALVVLGESSPEEEVVVSARAAHARASELGLVVGERISVRQLLYALLMQSSNDAAVALAEHVAGSQAAFVAMMNAEAKKLRLPDTHFANPDGLDAADHYSSAHDVTRLARIAMKNPFIREIVGRSTATIAGGRTLTTWNDLLGSFPGVFGVKTGHTTGAGWSEVAAARAHGVTIYATLLGAPARETRNADLAELLAWGIARYRRVKVVSPERIYATAAAPYGRHRLALVAANGVTRLVRVDRPLVERVVAPSAVSLPVRKGEPLGEVRVYAGSKLITHRPLVAARSIARPGFVGRTEWYMGRTLHHVGSWFT